MNHIWTEKDINNAIKRLQKYQNCEDGLVVKHIKSGNIAAQDWRNLMVKLVELGHAFDNGESHETDKYQISINWNKQTEIFKPFFPPALLLHPDIMDLPPRATFGKLRPDVERLLGRQLTLFDRTQWVKVKSNWLIVHEILCGFQTTGKFEIGTCHESLGLGKVDKKYLILKAKEVAYMYKALECGCIYKCIGIEHSEKSDEAVAIELFIDLLNHKARSQFMIYCLHPGSSNPRAEPDHIRNFLESYTKGIELFSRPVPDDGHDLEVYKYELKETYEDFLKARDLMNKNIPPRLLDFVAKIELAPTSPTVYFRKLLDSSIPEVVEKAQRWAEAELNCEDLKITQGFIRNQYDQKRSGKQK